jgi:hypothetical protein
MNVVPAQAINQCGIAALDDFIVRVGASLADVEAGSVRKFTTAAELLAALDEDEDA